MSVQLWDAPLENHLVLYPLSQCRHDAVVETGGAWEEGVGLRAGGGGGGLLNTAHAHRPHCPPMHTAAAAAYVRPIVVSRSQARPPSSVQHGQSSASALGATNLAMALLRPLVVTNRPLLGPLAVPGEQSRHCSACLCQEQTDRVTTPPRTGESGDTPPCSASLHWSQRPPTPLVRPPVVRRGACRFTIALASAWQTTPRAEGCCEFGVEAVHSACAPLAPAYRVKTARSTRDDAADEAGGGRYCKREDGGTIPSIRARGVLQDWSKWPHQHGWQRGGCIRVCRLTCGLAGLRGLCNSAGRAFG